ncbi:MAG: DUF6477 family protein [Paracoccus sp. (in: a-proteobacteria)]
MCFVSEQKIFQTGLETAPLRRPATLIRAARAGQAVWRRKRDLPRLLGRETIPAASVAMRMLRAAEEAADHARREGRADYDMHRHVRLLIALLAEIRAVTADPALSPQKEGGGPVLTISGREIARPVCRA